MTVVKWKNEAELVTSLSPVQGAQITHVSGECGDCAIPYAKGDWVFRNNTGVLIGVNCCATQYVGPLQSSSDAVDFPEDYEGRDMVPLSLVMPHGKTRADMCRNCFQIPSSSNVCGCP